MGDQRPKVNTVYLYLGHLIETDKLPRHVSKKSFYEHFVKYYEEQWHEPWTGNMETVMETFRVLEATADKVGLESPLGIGHRWKFGVTPEDDKRSLLLYREPMLNFPKDETLKTWLDKLITDRNWIKAPPSPELEPEPQPQPDPIDKEPETKEPDPERRPMSPEPSEELSERRAPSPEPSKSEKKWKNPETKSQKYYAKNRTRILAHQQRRRDAVRNGFLTFRQRQNAVQGSVYFDKRDKNWRIHYKKDYYGTYKTEEEAREVLAKLNTLTPEQLAVEKKRLVKPPNGDRKKQQVNPSDLVRKYDQLRVEITKRQDELTEMRSKLKSLGDKKRKFEIEEEERMCHGL